MESETECQLAFNSLGDCYHLWTPENFEIIFTCDEDFRVGMGIVAICAALFPDVKCFTYELMTNHLHFALSGKLSRILEMFALLTKMLQKFTKSRGRTIDWSEFRPGIRKLETLEELRNTIVYINRNGFIVRVEFTPYTYPWGANRYYFNEDAKTLAIQNSTSMSVRYIRLLAHSKTGDGISSLKMFEDCALPLSFCDIKTGEKLFHNASHYFYKLSRSIEANQKIAKEIGESIFYTDDELYSAISKQAKTKYGVTNLAEVKIEGKMDLAKTMRFDYHASDKQIMRMLRLPLQTLVAMGLAK